MKLNEAVREIIGLFGIGIMSDTKFSNLLDDKGGFKETPMASKKILRGLISSGFGSIVIDISNNKDSGWQNRIRKGINDFTTTSGFSEDLVNQLVSELLIGAGIIGEAPVSTQSLQQGSPRNKPVKSVDYKELLSVLQEDYKKSLTELITITKDEFGFNYGYFDYHARTQLYIIESKILILGKELNLEGLDKWITKQKQQIEGTNRPTKVETQSALDKLIINLEDEFKNMMSKNFIVEDDEFGLKSARFTKDAEKELSGIEFKLLKLSKRKNEDKKTWIEKTRKDFLSSESSPSAIRIAVLDNLKKEYDNRLRVLDTQTKNGILDLLSDKDLNDIEGKIIRLSNLVNFDGSQWCKNQREKIITERDNRLSKAKKRKKIINIAAAFLLAGGSATGITFLASSEDRNHFESTMALGQKAEESGNYEEALNYYSKAEREYNAFYGSSSYKGEAHGKAVEISDRVFKKWQREVNTLLDNNEFVRAKKLTDALPQNLVLSDSDTEIFKSINEKMEAGLISQSNELINELSNDIYQNKGTLSANGKTKLKEMIEVVSDNYWLNFINDKVK
ncbi:MAG: hypothetical protein J1F67_10760 [Muribaculaceae bacterium]|nr:hypothetical protein [Muribaculaceae bacterium]